MSEETNFYCSVEDDGGYKCTAQCTRCKMSEEEMKEEDKSDVEQK
jgi:hypothetical protein